MNNIPDYSKVENFNIAAIKAVRENTKEKDIEDDKVSIVYKYKGRTLKVKAEVVVFGSMDGKPLLESVNVLSVDLVKGG